MDDKRRLEPQSQLIVSNQPQAILRCNNLMEKFKHSQDKLQRKEIQEELIKEVTIFQEYRERMKLILQPSDFSKSKLCSSDQKAVSAYIKSLDSFFEKFSKFRSQFDQCEAMTPPILEEPIVDKANDWILATIAKLKSYLALQEAEIDTKKGAKNRDVRTTMRIQIKQTTSHIVKMEGIKEAYLRKEVKADAVNASKRHITDFVNKLITGAEVNDDPALYDQLKDVGQPLVCHVLAATSLSQPGRRGIQSRTPIKQTCQSSPQPSSAKNPAVGAHSFEATAAQMARMSLSSQRDTPSSTQIPPPPVEQTKPSPEEPSFHNIPRQQEIPKEVYDSLSDDMKKRMNDLLLSNYDQTLYHINERLPFVPYYAALKVPDSHPIGPSNFHMSYAFFKKLDLDKLFTLFYYMPETLVQFIAVKVLKSRGWRFLRHGVTWFKPVEGQDNVYDCFDYRQWIVIRNSDVAVNPDELENSEDIHYN